MEKTARDLRRVGLSAYYYCEIGTDDLKQIVQTTAQITLVGRLRGRLCEGCISRSNNGHLLRLLQLLPINQLSQGKDGCGRRSTTPRSMAVIQATTATTLNPSPDKKQAVGKNTKWNENLPE